VCGIAATIDLRRAGRASPWSLPHMRHRGPDGSGVLADVEGDVVLEHTRLAIIDPTNRDADQPLVDSTGRWAIVYNGEIFNYRELRTSFVRRGAAFRTNSDTEVVLVGFSLEGPRLLEQLRGMFAFVIWDRETGDIFIARDQIGVKPLYWFINDGVFAAASEIRTLLAHPSLRVEIDPVGVVEYLAFGCNLSQRTIVKGISKVSPGHYLCIREGNVTTHEYWDVLPMKGARIPHRADAYELRTELNAAVQAALVSDVPVGHMLSGGIDSSTVATLAVRHAPASEMSAYSVAFGRADDESTVARLLARDLGLQHRIVRVDRTEVQLEFEEWLGALDYPTANPTWIATWFVARAAHSDGVKVLLSGDGGDELFGGYDRWMKYLRFHAALWARTPNSAKRIGGHLVLPLARGLARDIARRAAHGGELFVPSRPFHEDLLTEVLGPVGLAAASAVPAESTVDRLRLRYQECCPDGDYLGWMSYVTLRTKLVEDYLQRLDKMGMQHSVEGRVPLLDPILARWAFSATQSQKVPALRQKALLREAVSPLLPGYILERPKQGFCAPIADWMGELMRPRVVSSDGPLFDCGLLRRDAFGSTAVHGGQASIASWTLNVLIDWVNRNLATAGVADVEAIAA
jgi:asparagine synthase (glutamine-hydrolysing)